MFQKTVQRHMPCGNASCSPKKKEFGSSYGDSMLVIRALIKHYDIVTDKSNLWINQISLGSSLDPRQTKGLDSYGSP
jgi:hypothetical protein